MSDTEESRTATVGRKRKQNGDSVQLAHMSDKTKRPKLDPDANFIALDSDDNSLSDGSDASKESGEVSSGSSTPGRRASKSSAVSAEVVGSFDLDGDGKAIHKQQSGPPRLDLEAIYPPAMQTWVGQQMTATSKTPEEILEHATKSKAKGQPYGRASKNFLRQWNSGFRKTFPECSFLELQRVIENPGAVRKNFDISSLRKRDDKLGENIKRTLQQHPGELPQFVLLGWIRDMKMHTAACQAMRSYVDNNLRPQFTPINKAPAKSHGLSTSIITNSSSTSSKPDPKPQQPTPNSSSNRVATDHMSISSDSSSSSSDASDSDSYSPPTSPSNPSALKFRDLSSYDQVLQTRYFNITSPSALIRCTSCSHLGHQPATCPALTCAHCSSRAHLTRHCPPHRKCTRCRRRGHSGKTCTRATVQPGGLDDPCDICGKTGHGEEECIGLWTTYDPDDESRGGRKRIPREQMAVGCYNCGAEGHWGDDCPDLPGFITLTHDTFSRRNAERYIIGGNEDADTEETEGRTGDGGLQSRSVQAHQLMQLGDYY